VLYYVPDLSGTIERILAAMAPGGRFVTAIAGRDNALVDFWFRSFPMIGMEVPYHTAEDVEATLTARGRAFRRQDVRYELTFPDSEPNRLAILRFLLGEYLPRMPRREVLELVEPYNQGGRIVVRTGSMVLRVQG
jgi:hypothetical protein